MSTTEENQSSDLEKFSSKALRGVRKGIYQQLMCNLLLKASRTNDPLIKIQTLSEAAHFCTQKTNLDLDFVEVVEAVGVSFLNTKPSREGVVKVTWSFPETEENYKKYIEPWQHIHIRYYPMQTPLSYELHPRTISAAPQSLRELKEYSDWTSEAAKSVHKRITQMRRNEAFWQQTAALSTHSFAVLKSEFVRWALPTLGEIQATLSTLIDPTVFKEVVWLTTQREETAKKGETLGDSLGKRHK